MLLSWWQQRNHEHVLFLHFEDLLEDLAFCVEKIAEFTEMPLPLDVEKRAKLLHQCTHAHMLTIKVNCALFVLLKFYKLVNNNSIWLISILKLNARTFGHTTQQECK